MATNESAARALYSQDTVQKLLEVHTFGALLLKNIGRSRRVSPGHFLTIIDLTTRSSRVFGEGSNTDSWCGLQRVWDKRPLLFIHSKSLMTQARRKLFRYKISVEFEVPRPHNKVNINFVMGNRCQTMRWSPIKVKPQYFYLPYLAKGTGESRSLGSFQYKKSGECAL